MCVVDIMSFEHDIKGCCTSSYTVIHAQLHTSTVTHALQLHTYIWHVLKPGRWTSMDDGRPSSRF